MPINIDPGVHSSLNLEQLAAQSGGFHPVATLPTIAEAKVNDSDSPSSPDSQLEIKITRPQRPHRNSESSEGNPIEFGTKNMPRNASQPAFTSHHQGMNSDFHVTLIEFNEKICHRSTQKRFGAVVRSCSKNIARWI